MACCFPQEALLLQTTCTVQQNIFYDYFFLLFSERCGKKKKKGECEKECKPVKRMLCCKSGSPGSALSVTTDVSLDFEAKSIQPNKQQICYTWTQR